MPSYTYSIAADFGGQLNPGQFQEEIEDDVVLSIPFEGIQVRIQNADDVVCMFTVAINKPDLDALVAAYVYDAPMRALLTISAFSDVRLITTDGTWDTLASIPANLTVFAPPSRARVRVVFFFVTSGAGARVRLFERDTGRLLGIDQLPDTGNARASFVLRSTADPRRGLHLYVIQGDRSGVANARLVGASLLLLTPR